MRLWSMTTSSSSTEAPALRRSVRMLGMTSPCGPPARVPPPASTDRDRSRPPACRKPRTRARTAPRRGRSGVCRDSPCRREGSVRRSRRPKPCPPHGPPVRFLPAPDRDHEPGFRRAAARALPPGRPRPESLPAVSLVPRARHHPRRVSQQLVPQGNHSCLPPVMHRAGARGSGLARSATGKRCVDPTHPRSS